VKAYTYRGITGPGGTVVTYPEYYLSKGIRVQAGKVSYIGQLFMEDPRLKGKGYFGHLLAPVLALPEDMEISTIDESDDDIAWLEENTKTNKPSVVNAVKF